MRAAGWPADCIWVADPHSVPIQGACLGALAGGTGPFGELRGKVRMMADVACFCGCVYYFDGDAGACPGCGEVATLTVRRASVGTQRGQQEQPGPAANGHERGEQTATLREWPELIPVPRLAVAMSDSTSRAGIARPGE